MAWTTEVTVTQLRQKKRWKVDFFASTISTRNLSGFPTAALRDLVDDRREAVDPQVHPDELLDYVGLENVESRTGDLIGFRRRYGKEIRSRSKRFYEGDVLYGRLRPYLNKVLVATGNIATGICSGEFYVLVPRQALVRPDYLRAILSSEYVQKHVASWQTGSALPRLQLDDLLGIELPLPSMEEQEAFQEFVVRRANLRRRLKQDLKTLEDQTVRLLADAIERGSVPRIHDDNDNSA